MLRLMPFALTLLLWAAGVLTAPCASAEDLNAPVLSPSVSVDGLRSFVTSGKAVYPFTEGDKTEATLFEHEGRGCLTHMNKEDHSFSAYRFHEEDPIFFAKGLRLTLRCGEEIGDQRHNKRIQRWKAPPTAYTTYVWIYEW